MSASEKINAIKRKYQVRIKIALREAAKELAQVILLMVEIRTQIQGKGTNGDLDELDDAYVKQRRKNKSRLSKATSPEKSNLTATGQMIKALQGKSEGSKAIVSVKPSNRRKELNKSESKYNNDQIRKFVEDNGREFLKLSESEKDKVIESAKRILSRLLSDLS